MGWEPGSGRGHTHINVVVIELGHVVNAPLYQVQHQSVGEGYVILRTDWGRR